MTITATASDLTFAAIRHIRVAAGISGDDATISMCDRARNGSRRARMALARLIVRGELAMPTDA
jgi:hypothetical protein